MVSLDETSKLYPAGIVGLNHLYLKDARMLDLATTLTTSFFGHSSKRLPTHITFRIRVQRHGRYDQLAKNTVSMDARMVSNAVSGISTENVRPIAAFGKIDRRETIVSKGSQASRDDKRQILKLGYRVLCWFVEERIHEITCEYSSLGIPNS